MNIGKKTDGLPRLPAAWSPVFCRHLPPLPTKKPPGCGPAALSVFHD